MKNKIIFTGLIFAVFMVVVFTASAATTITLKVEKNGKGTISSDDGKINCGSDCKEIYYSGGSINLYATSAKGFAFDKWTGNACGDSIGVGISTSTEITIGQCQVSLYYKNNKTITAVAHFKKVSISSSSSKSSKSPSSKSYSSKSSKSSASSTPLTYTLKINKSGKGYVSDEYGRITCGMDCKEEYVAGSKIASSVKLRAVPNGGYVFKKFAPEKECTSVYSDGFGFNDNGNLFVGQAFAYEPAENVVCVTTMDKNKTITAVFEKIKK